MVSQAAAQEISCRKGDRYLSLICLPMGFVPRAILPVWEWAVSINCWGQSSKPHYLHITPCPPNATLDEMAAIMFNKGGDLYSRQGISNCLEELDVTRKWASTKGYQLRNYMFSFVSGVFWNCPPPLGVFQVPRRILIDCDKFGVTLEKCNCIGG